MKGYYSHKYLASASFFPSSRLLQWMWSPNPLINTNKCIWNMINPVGNQLYLLEQASQPGLTYNNRTKRSDTKHLWSEIPSKVFHPIPKCNDCSLTSTFSIHNSKLIIYDHLWIAKSHQLGLKMSSYRNKTHWFYLYGDIYNVTNNRQSPLLR